MQIYISEYLEGIYSNIKKVCINIHFDIFFNILKYIVIQTYLLSPSIYPYSVVFHLQQPKDGV